MASVQPSAKTGFLAGGIAALVALLSLRILSEQVIPFNLLLDVLTDSVMRHIGYRPGWFGDFLWGSHTLAKLVGLIVLGYLLVGGALGSWSGAAPAMLQRRVIASGFILFLLVFLLLVSASGMYLRSFAMEIYFAMAVSSVLYAMVLGWLLNAGDVVLKWQVGALLALISVGLIVGELWLLG